MAGHVPVRDQLPALRGPKAHIYQQVAEEFLTSATGHVKIEDFGTPQERLLVSPVISYLARRGSEAVRIELGLSRRENGNVKGAILRYDVGRYEYQPDLVWPQSGEVDPGLRRAEEHAVRRQAKRLKARQKAEKTASKVEAVQLPLTAPDAPVSAVAAPEVPPPSAAPPAPQEVTQGHSRPVVVHDPALDTVQILTQTDDLIVLRNGNDLIVASIKSVTSL
jgi:hypothetical protein